MTSIEQIEKDLALVDKIIKVIGKTDKNIAEAIDILRMTENAYYNMLHQNFCEMMGIEPPSEDYTNLPF